MTCLKTVDLDKLFLAALTQLIQSDIWPQEAVDEVSFSYKKRLLYLEKRLQETLPVLPHFNSAPLDFPLLHFLLLWMQYEHPRELIAGLRAWDPQGHLGSFVLNRLYEMMQEKQFGKTSFQRLFFLLNAWIAAPVNLDIATQPPFQEKWQHLIQAIREEPSLNILDYPLCTVSPPPIPRLVSCDVINPLFCYNPPFPFMPLWQDENVISLLGDSILFYLLEAWHALKPVDLCIEHSQALQHHAHCFDQIAEFLVRQLLIAPTLSDAQHVAEVLNQIQHHFWKNHAYDAAFCIESVFSHQAILRLHAAFTHQREHSFDFLSHNSQALRALQEKHPQALPVLALMRKDMVFLKTAHSLLTEEGFINSAGLTLCGQLLNAFTEHRQEALLHWHSLHPRQFLLHMFARKTGDFNHPAIEEKLFNLSEALHPPGSNVYWGNVL